MPIEHVDAKSDARLGDYLDLTDVALRTSFEAAHGLYIAESAKVILRALRAGHQPRSLLMSDHWLPRMNELIEEVASRFPDTPVFIAEEAVHPHVCFPKHAEIRCGLHMGGWSRPHV